MKKLITLIISIFIIFSCAVTAPSWTNIGSEGVYIENCRDTLMHDKIDSVLISRNIKSNYKTWPMMKYYNSSNDIMTQWTYITASTDTIYTISNFSEVDSLYIFTGKIKQNNVVE